MSDDGKSPRVHFNRSTDTAPLRDKDNAAPTPKPSMAYSPAPNLAPTGAAGITPRMPAQERPEGRPAPPDKQPGIDIREPLWTDKAYYTDGKITSMPGYSFMARVTDELSEKGINGGKIDQLVLSKDDQVVARYNQGWQKDPSTPEEREAIQRVRTGLGDQDREAFKGFDPDKTKDQGHER